MSYIFPRSKIQICLILRRIKTKYKALLRIMLSKIAAFISSISWKENRVGSSQEKLLQGRWLTCSNRDFHVHIWIYLYIPIVYFSFLSLELFGVLVLLKDKILRFFSLLILIIVQRDSWRILDVIAYSYYCFTNKGMETKKG